MFSAFSVQAQTPAAPAPVAGSTAEALAQQTSQLPLLPEDVPETSLPAGNFFQDDPAMSLDPNEGARTGAATAPGAEGEVFDFEKSPEQVEEESRKRAFEAALQGLMPLRSEEIRELLEHFDRTQESVETPVYPAPKPEVAVETVSLDPGAKPVTVKTAYGHVTTINFLDSTGAPWPVENISWAGGFEVVEPGNADATHILRITPQTEFATGNISVKMIALKTPLILTLDTARDMVHYRLDLIVPDYGPLAEAPIIDKGMTIVAGDEKISAILQGVLPPDAVKLAVAGADGRTTAYRHAGRVYVRTPLTLLSPSWSASVASADGMRVYSVQDTSVLLLSDKGKMVRARLSDRRDILENVSDGR